MCRFSRRFVGSGQGFKNWRRMGWVLDLWSSWAVGIGGGRYGLGVDLDGLWGMVK